MSLSVVENIDCMIRLREASDNHWDLAICDPPYSWNSGNAFTSRLKRYGDLTFNDSRPTSEYFIQLRRVSCNQIIWGGNYFLSDLDDTKCVLAWFKRQPVPTYANTEIAWTSFADRHSATFDYPFFGATNREVGRAHPNQKPVALYKWLLTNYAKPGDTILDTHLGSQSSRIAAWDLGFDFTGYELDPDYFREGNERFARHIAQGNLFTPDDAPKPTQGGLFTEKLTETAPKS